MLMKSHESRKKVGLLSARPRHLVLDYLLLGVRFCFRTRAETSTLNIPLRGNQRVKGIEPSCAAWEAAVLPLNYTRNVIFDFRFSIADCNRNKACAQNRLRWRHAKINHCQEITSSEFTPAFLSGAGPGTLCD